MDNVTDIELNQLIEDKNRVFTFGMLTTVRLQRGQRIASKQAEPHKKD